MSERQGKRTHYIDRAERIPFHREVLVSSFGSNDKHKVMCANVSASGLLILEETLPFGINALIELHLYSMDSQKHIKLVGKVVRTDPSDDTRTEYGVQFSFQDHRELALWSEYISILKDTSGSKGS